MEVKKMIEAVFDTEDKIKQGQKDLAIEFSNRMKYRLQVINRDIFRTFFEKAISFNYQELGGKYMGPMVYLSKAVAEKIKKDQNGIENPPKPSFKNTRHEHPIPKQLYVKYFYKNYISLHNKEKDNIYTVDYFKQFCENVCVCCIVTIEEDSKKLKKKMPEIINIDFDHPGNIKQHQIWARYLEAGIEVVKPRWVNNKLESYVVQDFKK